MSRRRVGRPASSHVQRHAQSRPSQHRDNSTTTTTRDPPTHTHTCGKAAPREPSETDHTGARHARSSCPTCIFRDHAEVREWVAVSTNLRGHLELPVLERSHWSFAVRMPAALALTGAIAGARGASEPARPGPSVVCGGTVVTIAVHTCADTVSGGGIRMPASLGLCKSRGNF